MNRREGDALALDAFLLVFLTSSSEERGLFFSVLTPPLWGDRCVAVLDEDGWKKRLMSCLQNHQ